jgi:hypothetical protein
MTTTDDPETLDDGSAKPERPPPWLGELLAAVRGRAQDAEGVDEDSAG